MHVLRPGTGQLTYRTITIRRLPFGLAMLGVGNTYPRVSDLAIWDLHFGTGTKQPRSRDPK